MSVSTYLTLACARACQSRKARIPCFCHHFPTWTTHTHSQHRTHTRQRRLQGRTTRIGRDCSAHPPSRVAPRARQGGPAADTALCYSVLGCANCTAVPRYPSSSSPATAVLDVDNFRTGWGVQGERLDSKESIITITRRPQSPARPVSVGIRPFSVCCYKYKIRPRTCVWGIFYLRSQHAKRNLVLHSWPIRIIGSGPVMGGPFTIEHSVVVYLACAKDSLPPLIAGVRGREFESPPVWPVLCRPSSVSLPA